MQQFSTENVGEIAQENVDQHVCRCVYLCNVYRRRGRGEEQGCPLQRAVYFVCLTAALAYAAAHSAYDEYARASRAVPPPPSLLTLFTTRYARPQTRYRQLCGTHTHSLTHT